MAEALNGRERAVQCDTCGARFERMAWTPGALCPKCGSAALAPIPVRSEGSDYATADRTAAFAIEDIRFGRLAQWAGFITPKQFQYALYQQKQFAAAGRKVPDIGTLFIQQKAMDRRHVQAILAGRRSQPRNKEDADFAAAAMQLGQVRESQVTECKRLQEQAALSGREPAPLPLLLCERRAMQESQVVTLLKNFERQNAGLLARIGRAAAPPPKVPLRKQILGEPHTFGRWMRTGAAFAAAILVVFFVYNHPAFSAGYVKVRCERCLGEFWGAADSKWPIKCPNCPINLPASAYPLALCLDCGNIFIVHGGVGYDQTIVCPKCGKSDWKLVTPEMDKNMAKLQEEIRNRKTIVFSGSGE